jgi:hypothetical protein
MGWRKWTILDGDLARCSELQRPRRYEELRVDLGDHLMRQHPRVAGLTAARVWTGLRTCSNRTVLVQ